MRSRLVGGPTHCRYPITCCCFSEIIEAIRPASQQIIVRSYENWRTTRLFALLYRYVCRLHIAVRGVQYAAASRSRRIGDGVTNTGEYSE